MKITTTNLPSSLSSLVCLFSMKKLNFPFYHLPFFSFSKKMNQQKSSLMCQKIQPVTSLQHIRLGYYQQPKKYPSFWFGQKIHSDFILFKMKSIFQQLYSRQKGLSRKNVTYYHIVCYIISDKTRKAETGLVVSCFFKHQIWICNKKFFFPFEIHKKKSNAKCENDICCWWSWSRWTKKICARFENCYNHQQEKMLHLVLISNQKKILCHK